MGMSLKRASQVIRYADWMVKAGITCSKGFLVVGDALHFAVISAHDQLAVKSSNRKPRRGLAKQTCALLESHAEVSPVSSS